MNVLNNGFMGDGNCTWGYYGTRGAAAKYLLTAGHCGALGAVFHLVAGPVGITDGADRNTFDISAPMFADAMVAHVKANANAHSPFNSIIGSSSDLAHPITVRKGNSQGQGATVCYFGFKSHPASPCGVIELTGINQLVPREDGLVRTVNDMVQMGKVPQKGDSGGPVYSGLAAYGIATALGTGGHLIYSKAPNAETGAGVTICLTTAC